jgi:predicted transcriptional regulator of viral defense system
MIYPGYAGFTTALRYYHLIDYEPFTVYTVTYSKFAKIQLGQYELVFIGMGERSLWKPVHDGFWVSTLEKTLFDCFYKPQRVGGLSVVTQAIYEADGVDWKEFIRIIDLYASTPLCQRIGYILELVSEEIGKVVPRSVLVHLRRKVRYRTKLDVGSKAPSKYCSKWMVQDNVGRENILGWWYGG